MNKKSFILIGIALVLAGIYVICFTSWLQPKTIQIKHTSRPARTVARAGTRAGAAANPMIFNLDDFYSLTEIKVVPLAALQKDKLTQPVWHLVSDSGSDDVDSFSYGQNISGMDPAVEGARPEPLESGVTYRLFVSAGKVRGQHDFHIGAAPANTATNR